MWHPFNRREGAGSNCRYLVCFGVGRLPMICIGSAVAGISARRSQG